MKKALFFIVGFFAMNLDANESGRSDNMSGHVFVVSEWLPKEGCEQELFDIFKNLMALTLENESGCIRAHATRQVSHPGAPGKSKYKIVLLQEYVDMEAFDAHCNAEYIKSAFEKYTPIIKEWRVRLLSD
jgi:quinol monooxygenase YgiN